MISLLHLDVTAHKRKIHILCFMAHYDMYLTQEHAHAHYLHIESM